MAAEDETPSTITDEQIIHELAKVLARDDRRSDTEAEIEVVAKFSLYETPARQFLLMYRRLWAINPTVKFEFEMDRRYR